jgi:hypothetical protein
VRQIQVPGGGKGHRRRQQRAVAAAFHRRPNADRRVGQLNGEQPEPRHSLDDPGATVRDSTLGLESAKPVLHLNLLVERHLLHDHLRALIGREGLVHPWPFGRRLPLRRLGRSCRDHQAGQHCYEVKTSVSGLVQSR